MTPTELFFVETYEPQSGEDNWEMVNEYDADTRTYVPMSSERMKRVSAFFAARDVAFRVTDA